jgi:hypothetical protein
VRPAFYPDLDFLSMVADAERRIDYGLAGMGGPIDRALDLLAAASSSVGIVLPSRKIDGRRALGQAWVLDLARTDLTPCAVLHPSCVSGALAGAGTRCAR